jgi:putative acetyltransferase
MRTTPRLARPDDIEQVHRIYTDERVIPFLGHDAMDLDAFRAMYERLLAARDFYVVEHERKVAGVPFADEHPIDGCRPVYCCGGGRLTGR